MMELGHMLAKISMPAKGKKPINVKLLVANEDLVGHYEQLLKEKERLADERIKFEWLSLATFTKKLEESPAQYAKDIIIADEGDTLLVREVNQQLGLSYPKHLLLLSAVPREAWTGT